MPDTVAIRRNNVSRMLCLDCGEQFVLNEDHTCDNSRALNFKDWENGLITHALIVGVTFGGGITILIALFVLHLVKNGI